MQKNDDIICQSSEIQTKKEVKYTIILYFMYFFWSILTAYLLGSGNPDEYSFILGFPTWFFFSCILSYIFCCIGVYLLIKFIFKESKKEDTQQK